MVHKQLNRIDGQILSHIKLLGIENRGIEFCTFTYFGTNSINLYCEISTKIDSIENIFF